MPFSADTYILAKNKAIAASKAYTDEKLLELAGGFIYEGDVNTFADLPTPTAALKGHSYIVKTATEGHNRGVYVCNGTAWTEATMKGVKGDTGDPGTAAGVGQPTVDYSQAGQVGTPEVNITATGPDTAKVFNFTFKNIKGEPGAHVALKAMKAEWKGSISTRDAAAAILADTSVVAGDGFLGTVQWTDLPSDLDQAEVKAFVIKKESGQNIVQFELTSSDYSPYAWYYNSFACEWRTYVPLNNTVTSASTTSALTANMGKQLQDQITNLQNIGRFLSIWDATLGKPTTNPTVLPYTYKTGDYYRVGTVSQSTNYMPNGSSYNGQASTTVYSGQGLSEGAVFYYDGIQWLLQASGGGGLVSDVQVNGTSILSGGVANIPLAGSAINGAMSSAQYTKLNGIEAGADITDATNVEAAGAIMKTAQSLTDGEKTQARTNIGAASYTYSSTAPTTLDNNTIHFVV